MNPSGGRGAVTAMHDAVALANWICSLKSKGVPELETIFKEYKAERYPIAKESFAYSQQMRNIGGKNLASKATRHLFRHMPKWLWRLAMAKNAKLRPQASFLPQVEDNGTVKAGYQPSLHKTLAILKERVEAEKRKDGAAAVAV
ncbi:hypothetical protein BGZ93_008407 [Podila epicladia]|nr:hypothetical protein BGZ93_008407 [Podila epicladia]